MWSFATTDHRGAIVQTRAGHTMPAITIRAANINTAPAQAGDQSESGVTAQQPMRILAWDTA